MHHVLQAAHDALHARELLEAGELAEDLHSLGHLLDVLFRQGRLRDGEVLVLVDVVLVVDDLDGGAVELAEVLDVQLDRPLGHAFIPALQFVKGV